MRFHIYLLTLLLCFFPALVQADEYDVPQSASPDGRYRFRWRKVGEDPYRLHLIERKTGKRLLFIDESDNLPGTYRYPIIDVVWSPNSQFFGLAWRSRRAATLKMGTVRKPALYPCRIDTDRLFASAAELRQPWAKHYRIILIDTYPLHLTDQGHFECHADWFLGDEHQGITLERKIQFVLGKSGRAVMQGIGASPSRQ